MSIFGQWFLLSISLSLIRPPAAMRFYNFYGQPGARLEANLSVYIGGEHGDENSLLFVPLDISLFYAPSAYVKELQGIWVDNIINYARWEAFSTKLSSEWSGITIYVSLSSRCVDTLAADFGASAVHCDVGRRH